MINVNLCESYVIASSARPFCAGNCNNYIILKKETPLWLLLWRVLSLPHL